MVVEALTDSVVEDFQAPQELLVLVVDAAQGATETEVTVTVTAAGAGFSSVFVTVTVTAAGAG